ncbi:MAG: glycosyltransferase family 2 protein [Myxococcales bacterium]|nr:glycosyltransferase family 2 protein [Myxococcales bacterium]MCB9708882.1 glycosyltransferase family 2 protein [Myxococcales bacterium]
MPAAYRLCALIPTYDNHATILFVVEQVKQHLNDIIVVDDGSKAPSRAVLEHIAMQDMAHVVTRAKNGGKGAAVKTGLETAKALGFSHALQIDADGQHDLNDVPKFVTASRNRPDALVLGTPLFDATAPKSRRWGRKLTNFWVHVQTRSMQIADALCGYRVYPVTPALSCGAKGDRMDFDPEIVVRMRWSGVSVVNIPTKVRYISAMAGGVSHFRIFRDNVLLIGLHVRLTFLSLFRLRKGPP